MNLTFPLPYFSLGDIPKGLSEQLGLGSEFLGGLLASVILLVVVMFPIFILTMKARNNAVMPLMLFLGIGLTAFEVAIGWMPIFVEIILILIIALFLARDVPSIFGGKD